MRPATELDTVKNKIIGIGLQAVRLDGKLWRIFALLVFWLLFKFLDPIGLDAAAKGASNRLFTALTMPFHNFGAPAGRDATAVVLLTDDTLKSWGESWPVRYARHARLLEDILDARPKAVLVDYRFATERNGDSLHEFDDAIAQSRAAGIPLLFTRGEVGNEFPELPEPLTPYQTITGWVGDPNYYPLFVGATGSSELRDAEPRIPIAAFDLYERLCATNALKSCEGSNVAEKFARPMLIRHGLDLDPRQAQALDVASCGDYAGAGRRLWLAMRLFAGTFTERFRAEPVAQRCPTTLTIPAESIVRSAIDHPGLPLSTLLTDKVVFYGDDRRGEHDVVDIPFRGEVPAVMVHAAAFENLVAYGSDYFKKPSLLMEGPLEINAEDVAELLVWLVLVVFFVAHDKSVDRPVEDARRHGSTEGTRSIVAYQRTSVAVIVGCTILMALYDGWSRGSANIGVAVIFLGTLLYAVAGAFLVFAFTYWRRLSHSFFGGLAILVALSIVLFVLNENLVRWPNGDWLGLVLIFLGLREAFDMESGGFVPEVESACSGGWHRLRALGRRAPPHETAEQNEMAE